MKANRMFLYGAIFGMVSPIIGLIMGLQVVPLLGTILMFPYVILSWLLGQPIGMLSDLWMMTGLLFSMLFWGCVFLFVAHRWKGGA